MVTEAVAGLRPPVFFKRRGRVEKAVSAWSPDRLDRAIRRLGDTVRDCRLNPALGPDILSDTLLTLARFAARASGR